MTPESAALPRLLGFGYNCPGDPRLASINQMAYDLGLNNAIMEEDPDNETLATRFDFPEVRSFLFIAHATGSTLTEIFEAGSNLHGFVSSLMSDRSNLARHRALSSVCPSEEILRNL